MTSRRLDPIHPGEILSEEFLKPLGLSANAVAKEIGVPVTRISEILRARRGISADTALRLGRFFGTSPELWLGLQAEYDLRVARRQVGSEVHRRISAPREVAPGEYRPVLKGVVAAVSLREQPAAYGVATSRKTGRAVRRRGGAAG